MKKFKSGDMLYSTGSFGWAVCPMTYKDITVSIEAGDACLCVCEYDFAGEQRYVVFVNGRFSVFTCSFLAEVRVSR